MALSVVRVNSEQADYIRCQGPLRHQWEEYNPPRNQVAPRILACPKRLFVYCIRCSTCRHWGLDEDGNLMTTPDYIHPEGYHWAKDERPTTQQMRLIVVRRRGR